MKQFLASILGMALILALTSCGNATDSDSPTGSSESSAVKGSAAPAESSEVSKTAGEPIEIRYYWWGDTTRNPFFEAACDEFEKANPGITVIRESSAWGEYFTKLSTMVAGGEAPDAIEMHQIYVSDYAARGVLADLEPFFNDGIIDRSMFSDSVYESGRVGGLMCMISIGVSVKPFVFNMELMNRFGLKPPAFNEDWTWDEFTAMAEEFSEAAKAAGEELYFTQDLSGEFDAFRYLAIQRGGGLFTEDGKFDFTVGWIKDWWNMYAGLREVGAIPDGATMVEDLAAPIAQSLYVQGVQASIRPPVNQMTLFQGEMAGVPLQVARVPTGPNGEQGVYIEGSYNSISASADEAHQLAAAKFLNFFTNSEEANSHLKLQMGAPPNSHIAEFLIPELNDTEKVIVEIVSDQMTIATPSPVAPAGSTEITSLFRSAAQTVWFGQATVDAAAEKFMIDAQAVLDSLTAS